MNLKKLTAFAMAAVMGLSFVGCSAKEDTTISRFIAENGFIKEVDTAVVELVDYKSLVIPADQHTPDEDTVAAYMNYQLPSQNLYEGVVYDGATLNIDYVGYIEGIPFSGGDTNGMGTEVTIGVTQYIDDFLQQLVGHKVGENFDIEVTFPENYGVEELNGKDAIFNITINSIIKTVVPEVTDEFCKENFTDEFNTADKFYAKVEEELSREMVNSYLYTTVFNDAEISEVPAVVADFVKDYILSTYEMQAANYGYKLDDYLGMVGFTSRDEFVEYFQADVDMFCEDYLIFTAIAEAEGYKATEKEVKGYFKTYLGTDDYSVAEELYGMPYLKFMALQTDMLDFLIDTAVRG